MSVRREPRECPKCETEITRRSWERQLPVCPNVRAMLFTPNRGKESR